MTLRFLPADLRNWNEPACKDLVLSFFSNERPLHGAAGLADWRLCGRLSRLIKRGTMSGKRGDSVMMPAGRRLPFERIFLFGLGKGERMDEELFAKHASWIRDVLKRAGSTEYALQPPGRATGLIAARRAAELWIELAKDDGADITLIDSEGAHKEMGEVLAGKVG